MRRKCRPKNKCYEEKRKQQSTVDGVEMTIDKVINKRVAVLDKIHHHHNHHHHHHHHHKHQGLGHLARSVSRVTTALASVSSVSQLFSFLLNCSGMILKGFGVVAFFAGVRASSFFIHLFCLVCIQSVVHGVWSRLSYGH
jgi:G3E family GTPase